MKRDANEKAIVETLRKCGFLVQQIDQGGGVPDLLVCAGWRVVLLEVKDGPKKKLTPAQQKWHAQWEGAPVFVVDSIESALAAVQDIGPQAKRIRELEAKVRLLEVCLDGWLDTEDGQEDVTFDLVAETERLLGIS